MSVITRAFRGRGRGAGPELPPGQYLTDDFPVLSAGPTPRIDLATWNFEVVTEAGQRAEWDWPSFLALPSESVTVDIHCVTKWSKLGTTWRGVPVETLLAGLPTQATHLVASSYGGYTTNLPLPDVLGGQAWVAYEVDGKPLPPEHGGPARLLVPHLYFWKSAKWVRSLRLMVGDRPGFWEGAGYHMYGDPWREQRYWGD
jgi:DMSO/TMAO reductase YedYZ molybdopterin-dependent catalytic subunit